MQGKVYINMYLTLII